MSTGKGGVLRYTMIVVDPSTNVPTPLVEGTPVPEWAKDLVHADDLLTRDEPDAETKRAPAKKTTAAKKTAAAKKAAAAKSDGDGEQAGDGEQGGDGGSGELYDPTAHDVDDVNNHLAEADDAENADEVARVLAAEAAGEAREGILQGPYAPDED